jgi:hypothetical protein
MTDYTIILPSIFELFIKVISIFQEPPYSYLLGLYVFCIVLVGVVSLIKILLKR